MSYSVTVWKRDSKLNCFSFNLSLTENSCKILSLNDEEKYFFHFGNFDKNHKIHLR